jgi:hypothetical protein
MGKRLKRKPNQLSALKKRLAKLEIEFAAAESESTKAKLFIQIQSTVEKIRIESMHRITGFNRMRGYEVSSGVAPGLGKRS